MKQCARILIVVLAVFLVCLALPADDKPIQKESKQAKPAIKPPSDAVSKPMVNYLPVVEVCPNGGAPVANGASFLGDYALVTLKAVNKGAADCTQASTVSYVFKAGGKVIKYETKEIAGIPKGGSVVVLAGHKVQITKDANVQFEITMTVDQTKKVIESKETDNSVTFKCEGRYPPR